MPDVISALRRIDWRQSSATTDAFLRRFGPLLLLIFAVCYYGQYYRSDINLGGEGGTAAVIAMRLMEGQRPIVDTYLGYNVMWFYPVAWMFEVTGPNYVALRVFFFSLCALIGIFGFLTVRRVTGLGWYALGVGVLLILIPGMQFRNYQGLLPILNAYVILQAFVLEPRTPRRRWIWAALSGFVLGLTYLIRIDVGVFFTVIYVGVVVLYPLGVKGAFFRRVPAALGSGIVCVGVALAIHVPFYLDARERGFGENFLEQYTGMWGEILFQAEKHILHKLTTAPPLPSPATRISLSTNGSEYLRVRTRALPADWQAADAAERANQAATADKVRQRESLDAIFQQDSFYDAAFIVILHLPILIGGIIIVFAGAGLFWALVVRDARMKSSSLTSLVTLGAALTLFPQYFFFRPDTPHLSEFMCPFLVAMACACFFAARRFQESRNLIIRAGLAGFVLLCATSEGLHFYHSYRKESAGTIAAKRKRSYELRAENGVNVLVKKSQQPWMQDLVDTILAHSTEDDWLVAYPYSPTINFMTNRRSYRHNLYVDNATMSAEKFHGITLAEIAKFQPAVIVIDDRDINNTEESRFSNWAPLTLAHIRERYINAGQFGENTVYVRPDKMALPAGLAPVPPGI